MQHSQVTDVKRRDLRRCCCKDLVTSGFGERRDGPGKDKYKDKHNNDFDVVVGELEKQAYGDHQKSHRHKHYYQIDKYPKFLLREVVDVYIVRLCQLFRRGKPVLVALLASVPYVLALRQ